MNPRTTSPWLLVAALICFLMPFFNVSCAGQNGQRTEVASLSGVQLVTGTTSDKIVVQGESTAAEATKEAPKPIAAVPLAWLDAGLIAAGAAAFFVMGRRKPVSGVVAAAMAMGSHLWLLIYMQNDWIAGQMTEPATKPAATEASLPSLGDAMIKLGMPQVAVSPTVGWWVVCVLVGLAMVAQYVPSNAGAESKS